MTAQQLWDLFTHADGPAVPFEAWAFGAPRMNWQHWFWRAEKPPPRQPVLSTG